VQVGTVGGGGERRDGGRDRGRERNLKLLFIKISLCTSIKVIHDEDNFPFKPPNNSLIRSSHGL